MTGAPKVAERPIERRCRTCGFVGRYATETYAEHHFPRHSCEKWLAKGLRRARYKHRLAEIDRTPKPCLHKVANHQHGTRACYVLDKCRCIPCSKAVAKAERDRSRLKAYGRYDKYVDAGPVREHLQMLGAYGIGLKQVARITGLSTGSLSKIMWGVYERREGPSVGRYGKGELVRGPSKRVIRKNAAKILAVEAIPENLGPGQVDPDRTLTARLHLRALVALGWSQQQLGNRLGVGRSNMAPIVLGDRVMTRGMVDRIEALYAEISMTPPRADDQRSRISVNRSKRYAAAHGWQPPLALDDSGAEVLELDAQEIDEQAVYRRIHGDRGIRLTRVDRLEVVARLHAAGLSDREIERRAGIHRDQVSRDRRTLGLPTNYASDGAA